MKNVPFPFLPDDFDPEDDIDALFFQLERYTPPADIVERIMQAVSELPISYAEQNSGHKSEQK
ncbi:hypothetical protein [Tengunoibacter tsumagoiensis]|uniref:Uncharacterized protein n=1 Tax=Tengunoibacter tsumagoiensis TaxID=2014871 RepID=A0A402A1P1_9CHLR|nr:hypothetical protein [Tengunoibacter tsumagoiensis]GCE12976.1 hypothetical protein KTT_28350 [Tengunoibacter tsumagoiensis]